MSMIISIRAPLPVTDTSLAAPVPRAVQGTTTGGASAVTEPALKQALQQAAAKPESLAPRLLDPSFTAEDSAARAAEDARQAYIRASIAAGISPLPLA